MNEPTAQSPKKGREFRIAVFFEDSSNPGGCLILFGVATAGERSPILRMHPLCLGQADGTKIQDVEHRKSKPPTIWASGFAARQSSGSLCTILPPPWEHGNTGPCFHSTKIVYAYA
jgi:hypothetical protein